MREDPCRERRHVELDRRGDGDERIERDVGRLGVPERSARRARDRVRAGGQGVPRRPRLLHAPPHVLARQVDGDGRAAASPSPAGEVMTHRQAARRGRASLHEQRERFAKQGFFGNRRRVVGMTFAHEIEGALRLAVFEAEVDETALRHVDV